ncbi:unnamed protein product [Arctogadus glacialis]
MNDLNLKLQGNGNTVCQLISAVRAFQRKLELYKGDLQEELLHFPKLLEQTKEKDAHQKHIAFVEKMIENFRTRFDDFILGNQILLCIGNPFLVRNVTQLEKPLKAFITKTVSLWGEHKSSYTEKPFDCFVGQGIVDSNLPKMRDPEPVLERLQGLGVEDLEDLSYLQESDLLSVLRPIEARKLLSLLQKTSQQDVLDSPPSNQSNQQFSRASTSTSSVTQSDEMHLSGGYGSENASSPRSTSSSSMDITPRRLSDVLVVFVLNVLYVLINKSMFIHRC